MTLWYMRTRRPVFCVRARCQQRQSGMRNYDEWGTRARARAHHQPHDAQCALACFVCSSRACSPRCARAQNFAAAASHCGPASVLGLCVAFSFVCFIFFLLYIDSRRRRRPLRWGILTCLRRLNACCVRRAQACPLRCRRRRRHRGLSSVLRACLLPLVCVP